MNAPAGNQISMVAVEQAIQKYVEDHYKSDGNGGMVCNVCESEIQQTMCFVSIHNKLFDGCVGGGSVGHVALPYCPVCEGVPTETRTCIHV